MPNTNDRLADYVPVSERIRQFYEEHTEGRILTTIVEHNRDEGFILMRAEVYRAPDDAQPASTGHAYEVQANGFVNKTSYIENCETGAVGRALAIMGYEIKRGIASREEMEKVERMKGNGKPKQVVDPQTPVQTEKDALSDYIKKGCGILNEAGDDIHWTPKSLTNFIKERFQVPNGLVDLTVEQLQEMKQEMHGRLDRLEAKKALMGVE